jgi:hypothetical protein
MDTLLTPLEHYQASFVLKALRDGWTVSLNADGEFIFTRDKGTLAKNDLIDINKTGYSRQFITKYLLP